jgi:hypothetical protein
MECLMVLQANYKQYYIPQYKTHYTIYCIQLQHICINDYINIISMITWLLHKLVHNKLYDLYITYYLILHITLHAITYFLLWLHVYYTIFYMIYYTNHYTSLYINITCCVILIYHCLTWACCCSRAGPLTFPLVPRRSSGQRSVAEVVVDRLCEVHAVPAHREALKTALNRTSTGENMCSQKRPLGKGPGQFGSRQLMIKDCPWQ